MAGVSGPALAARTGSLRTAVFDSGGGPSEWWLARACPAKEATAPMRSEIKGSSTQVDRPGSAFSAWFLEAARRRDRELREADAAPDGRGFYAGPWEVEPVEAGSGRVFAVVRAGQSVADGGRAVARCRRYEDALRLAAVLPALGVGNHLAIGDKPKPMGYPFHDGRRFVGHLSPATLDGVPAGASARPAYLHAARHLTADLDSLALLHRSLGFEALALLGRELMRRVGEG